MDVVLTCQRLIRAERCTHGLMQNASKLNSRFALITGYMSASCFSPRTGSANRKRERTQIILFPFAQGSRIVITRFRERVYLVYSDRECISQCGARINNLTAFWSTRKKCAAFLRRSDPRIHFRGVTFQLRRNFLRQEWWFDLLTRTNEIFGEDIIW